MKILYIFRNIALGYSMHKVFQPIIEEVAVENDVDTLELPCAGYKPHHLLKNIMFARKKIANSNYDIVHITGTEHYLLPFIGSKNSVVTVHDFNRFTQFNLGRLRSILYKLVFISTLKKAKAVTFISDKVKEDASKLVTLHNVCVINDCFSPNISFVEKKISNPPVVLQIGTKQNKNLIRTIEALSCLNIVLRIIGRIPNNVKDILDHSGINYENAMNLTDQEIEEEYRKCDIVSFPSLYEGFGMPIIEGQATGRIVVTSSITPMKDIAGNGAILVDPYNISSIRDGFKEAINQPSELVQLGLENSKRFKASAIANEYMQLYESLCNHSKIKCNG